MKTLICDCNRTLALDERALSAALNEPLTRHSALCRNQAAAFMQAAGATPDGLLVACTQEQRLLAELAQAAAGQGQPVPLRFVNIRERAGWGRESAQATPKQAALLAVAQLPDPEPVGTASYTSRGRALVIGARDAAEQAAALVLAGAPEGLDVTVFATGAGQQGGAQVHSLNVLAGRIDGLRGYLGAFKLSWTNVNPIALDLCTRCNACLAACPEGAIGLDYQIDLAACRGHRACVRACEAVGAIDFDRPAATQHEDFDLVLDLRVTPAFSQHAKPQGYLHWDGRDLGALLAWRALVGTFTKPRFTDYQAKRCAHSRNRQVGCQACVDVCSASAIRSDTARQQVSVDPHLCVGCGTCSTMCPSGAMRFAYPRAADQGMRIKTLLTTYTRNGGRAPALLLHSQGRGAALLDDLGRAAQIERHQADGTRGLPARVLPLALWHTSSVGIDLWLSAVAYGAANVWVLLTDEEAPQYAEALQAQMDVAQAILTGLGYAGAHLGLLRARDARDLADLDRALQAPAAQVPTRAASFAVQADKRATLMLALDHLIAHAPRPARDGAIALPASGSPLGALAVDTAACTMCLSCVGACPAGALLDNPQAPQLRFIEQNCVQCGLCVKTCPERALSLVPRLNLAPTRAEPVVINAMQPYACVRCGKPFGTVKSIEAMLTRLAGSSHFQGAALERLKMCADCRVIDIHTATDEVRITDL